MSLRAGLFNIVFYVNLAVFLILGSPLFFAPRIWAIRALQAWARSSLWWLRVIVGMRMEVRGREHIPQGAAMIASKHQSLWDTFALLPLLDDPAMVLKRELNWIPLYGWFAVKFAMIPVDRGGGARVLKRLIETVRTRAEEGRQIVIFPEGTRRSPGAVPAYQPGIAALYKNVYVPCVPVALNSGLFWPRRSLARHKGTIIVEFLEPVPPGLPLRAFLTELEGRIEAASDALVAEGLAAENPPPAPDNLMERFGD